jgi:hypothetical protein
MGKDAMGMTQMMRLRKLPFLFLKIDIRTLFRNIIPGVEIRLLLRPLRCFPSASSALKKSGAAGAKQV